MRLEPNLDNRLPCEFERRTTSSVSSSPHHSINLNHIRHNEKHTMQSEALQTAEKLVGNGIGNLEGSRRMVGERGRRDLLIRFGHEDTNDSGVWWAGRYGEDMKENEYGCLQQD
ncbi:hypothetical protein PMIN06_010345 [Paraphaeosphaeria minitans]